MTKLYRVVAYVLNLNGDCETAESVVQNIEHNRHPEFISVEDIQVADCGEWDDDHELNKGDASYAKYFPEFDKRAGDPEFAKAAIQDLRGELLKALDRQGAAEREARHLREEIGKLKKVQEFVKTIGELTK